MSESALPRLADRDRTNVDNTDGSRRGRTGLKPLGRKFLVVGTLAAVIAGTAAGAFAGDADLLRSNVLFRVAVGGGVFTVVYFVLSALFWASHGKTFKTFPLPWGGSAQAPDDDRRQDEQNVAQGLDELEAMTKRAENAEAMIDTLKEQLDKTTGHVEHLSRENERLARENDHLRGGLEVMEESSSAGGNPASSGPKGG